MNNPLPKFIPRPAVVEVPGLELKDPDKTELGDLPSLPAGRFSKLQIAKPWIQNVRDCTDAMKQSLERQEERERMRAMELAEAENKCRADLARMYKAATSAETRV